MTTMWIRQEWRSDKTFLSRPIVVFIYRGILLLSAVLPHCINVFKVGKSNILILNFKIFRLVFYFQCFFLFFLSFWFENNSQSFSCIMFYFKIIIHANYTSGN